MSAEAVVAVIVVALVVVALLAAVVLSGRESRAEESVPVPPAGREAPADLIVGWGDWTHAMPAIPPRTDTNDREEV